MEYYLSVLQKYVVFEGRARRKEYWMFFLINLGISLVLSLLGFIGLGFIQYLYSLAVLLPSLAVGVRRLHDINKSGWWLLISFIPLVGVIWLIVLLAKEGDAGPNQYGEDPKA